MKNLFQAVKDEIPLPEAARRFGVEANAAGMALCPFHEDHSPSLRLYRDHYYCFGCHAHGDAVDLVAFLTGYRPGVCARLLADEFSLSI